MTKKINHGYLLLLYSRVNEFLSNGKLLKEDLPDVIVSFCTVAEKILKIKLHDKNPVLVFDRTELNDNNKLSTVILKKENDIKTSDIVNIIERFEIVFKGIFTSDELQVLRDIYRVRCCFVHGYKSDNKINFNAEDIVKKMGTLWEKISKMAILLFGRKTISDYKPKKKYSEQELENVLISEVKEKIKQKKSSLGAYGSFGAYKYGTFNSTLLNSSPSIFLSSPDVCPRCKERGFSFEEREPFSVLDAYGLDHGRLVRLGLYKCYNCGLELTPREYEIAKEIKEEEGF